MNKYAEVKINNSGSCFTAVISYDNEGCKEMNKINQPSRASRGFKAKLSNIKILFCDVVKIKEEKINKIYNLEELQKNNELNSKLTRIIEKENIFATPKSAERGQQMPRAFITYWKCFKSDDEMLKKYVPNNLTYEEI